MEFKETFSREFLQDERARFLKVIRIAAITTHIQQTYQRVLGAAREGKTEYTVETSPGGFRVGDYTATADDLLEGYRAKFPGCKVEHGETWEASPRNPNQMNKKSGIIIDWS
jgi:hypothetical protein